MKLSDYRKYFDGIIEQNQIKDLSKYEIRYSERVDFRTVLEFNFQTNEWELPLCKNNAIISPLDVRFELLEMIKKHEEIGPLLSFLIKDHTYMVSFQIPEYTNNPNIYPFLDEGESNILITDEYDKEKKLLRESCFDRSKMTMLLYDIEDINHLYNILEKIDSISSGYLGVELVDYENNRIITINSHSYITLQEYEYMSIYGPENFCFELIKRNEMTIYNEIYEDEEIKRVSHFVLNKILKSVFEILVDAMNFANKPVMDSALAKIAKMSDDIKSLYHTSLTILSSSKLSPSIILWRQMVDKDIEYHTIKEAYDTLN